MNQPACSIDQMPARPRFTELVNAAKKYAPVKAAVVHPVDSASLAAALAAKQENLFIPILVGPRGRIEAAARELKTDLADITIIDTPHSHAAAHEAVRLAQSGAVQVLVKGALHTDELMREVVAPDNGLSTERRQSHVYILDIPSYHKPLLISDCAINIAPDLMTKRDIVQNAIDLAQILGISCPRVAILSAVETVSPKIPSTIDAAALCKMADRGQISGAVLDGPLAFDNAISRAAAVAKNIHSPVAGDADILIAPNLEAGNILAKQFFYSSDAEGAGLVVGARVPVILTSRSDSLTTKTASYAVGLIMAHHGVKPPWFRK